MSVEIAARLSAPFDPSEVKWKPQVVSGGRAMAIAYVDARVVMDRLDEVLGLGGWQASYREVPDGIVCRLRAKLAGEWVDHEDVGSYSEQPDEGDRIKAAFSDALKRAAVHLGIGRYLYRLPSQWVDYDPQKKQLKYKPELPAWAMPARPETARQEAPRQTSQQPKQSAQLPTEQSVEAIRQRAHDCEAKLIERGLCQEGELFGWLVDHCGSTWAAAPEKDIRQAIAEFVHNVSRDKR